MPSLDPVGSTLPYSPLRVGIIGAGFVGRGAHVSGWRTVPGARLAAVCDVDPSALDAVASLTPGAQTFRDYRDLLEMDLDAVSVCTPNAAHFEIARDALRAGFHVLCEKPLCPETAAVRMLGAEADARGLVLMARHPLRFTASARAAHARMLAGDVGPVRHVRAHAVKRAGIPTTPGLMDRDQASGGAALDLGVHALDMALWLMDFPSAVRVTGVARTDFGQGRLIAGRWGDWDRTRFTVEDFAAGFVHFANGSTLSLECAWAGHYAEEGVGCTLFGEKASLHWPSGELVSQGQGFRREYLEIPATAAEPASEFSAFAAAIRSTGASPVPWREAEASIRILEGLYRSVREGREVELKEREKAG